MFPLTKFLKGITFLMVATVLMAASFVAYANPEEIISEVAFLTKLVESLGGLGGMTALGIAALATQLIMLALKTSLAAAKVPGKIRLLLVCGLSLVTGVLGLLAADVDFGAALLHSTTLAAFQVLLHQVKKQFVEKAD
jgi:hypothetical protein